MKRLHVGILSIAVLCGVGMFLGSQAFASGGLTVTGCPCHGAMKTQVQQPSMDGLLKALLGNAK